MRLGGDGALLRRDTTEHETKPNHAVQQGPVPLLRETRKIPYSISKNDVTENRPLLQNLLSLLRKMERFIFNFSLECMIILS